MAGSDRAKIGGLGSSPGKAPPSRAVMRLRRIRSNPAVPSTNWLIPKNSGRVQLALVGAGGAIATRVVLPTVALVGATGGTGGINGGRIGTDEQPERTSVHNANKQRIRTV